MGGRSSKAKVASGGRDKRHTASTDATSAPLVAEYTSSKLRGSGRIAWDEQLPSCNNRSRHSEEPFVVDRDRAREERKSTGALPRFVGADKQRRRTATTPGYENPEALSSHRPKAPQVSAAELTEQSFQPANFEESQVAKAGAAASGQTNRAAPRTSATATVATAGASTTPQRRNVGQAADPKTPPAPAHCANAMPAAGATHYDCGAQARPSPAPPPPPQQQQQPAPGTRAPAGDKGDAAPADQSVAADAVQWVLRPGPPIENTYKIGKVLGQGSFGVVRAATHLVTGAEVAVKTIRKSLLRAADMSSLRREVEILHHLSGHPHISQLLGVHEEPRQLHLVLELYQGGDLFDAIIGGGRHSERTAADVMRTVLKAIGYCHAMGVAHRDIKPENFMLTAEQPPEPGQQQQQQKTTGENRASGKSLGARLKLIDFGLSAFCTDETPMTEIVGTSYYVAPEVLEGNYSLPADVWSAGVILHIMLTGYAPFDGRDDKEILRAVRKGKVDLTADAIWKTISREAAAVMLAMLERDPKKRATADQVLSMPWLGRTSDACTAPNTPLPSVVSERMHQFAKMNSFQKEARRVVAGLMRPEEVAGLVAQFRGLDADRDGRLSIQELKDGLARQAQLCGSGSTAATLSSLLDERVLREMVRRSDLNGDGMLDESEFLGAVLPAAALSRHVAEAAAAAATAAASSASSSSAAGVSRPVTTGSASSTGSGNAIAAAFAHFDTDGSGYITADELRRALAGHHHLNGHGTDIEVLLQRHDRDADGRISYAEFREMLVQEAEDDDKDRRGGAADQVRSAKCHAGPSPPQPPSTTLADSRLRAPSRGAWGPNGSPTAGRASGRRPCSGAGLLRGDSARYGGGQSRSSTVAAQPPSGVASPLEWSDECDFGGPEGCEDEEYGVSASGGSPRSPHPAAASRRPIGRPSLEHVSSFSSGGGGGCGGAYARVQAVEGTSSPTSRLAPQPPPQPPSQLPPARLSLRCGSASRYGPTAAAAAAAAAAAVAAAAAADVKVCADSSPARPRLASEYQPRPGNEIEQGGLLTNTGSVPTPYSAANPGSGSGGGAASDASGTAGCGFGGRQPSRPAPPPPLQVPAVPVVNMRGRRHSTCGMVPEPTNSVGSPMLVVSDPRVPLTPRAGPAVSVCSRIMTHPGTPEFAYHPNVCGNDGRSPASPKGAVPYGSSAFNNSLPGSPSAATAAHRIMAARASAGGAIGGGCSGIGLQQHASQTRSSPQQPLSPARASPGPFYSPHTYQQPQPQQLLPVLPCGNGSSSPEGEPCQRTSGSPFASPSPGGTPRGTAAAAAAGRAAASPGRTHMAARHPHPQTHPQAHAVTTSGGTASSLGVSQRSNTPSAPLPLLLPVSAMRSRRQSTGSSAWHNGNNNGSNGTNNGNNGAGTSHSYQLATLPAAPPSLLVLQQPANPLSPRVQLGEPGVGLGLGYGEGAGAGRSPSAGRRSRWSTAAGLNEDPPLIFTARASMDLDGGSGQGMGFSGDGSIADDDFASVLPPGVLGGYCSSTGCGLAGGGGGAAGAMAASSISSRVLPPSFIGLQTTNSTRV